MFFLLLFCLNEISVIDFNVWFCDLRRVKNLPADPRDKGLGFGL